MKTGKRSAAAAGDSSRPTTARTYAAARSSRGNTRASHGVRSAASRLSSVPAAIRRSHSRARRTTRPISRGCRSGRVAKNSSSKIGIS